MSVFSKSLGCWVCILFFSLVISNSRAQLREISRIEISATHIAVDNLDNVYVVSDKNELLKYDSTGNLLYRFANKNLGNKFRIDVSDPFRIMVFYPSFQQVVILDNTLSEIARYTFNEQFPVQITALAAAGSTGFWAFDQTNQELIKYTRDFFKGYRTGNLSRQTGKTIQLSGLYADENYVYLQSISEVLLFDQFGAFIKTVSIDKGRFLQVVQGKIVWLSGNGLEIMDVENGDVKSTPLSGSVEFKKVALGNKIMASVAATAVYIFGIPDAFAP
jgi:hypothetical protein